MPKKKKIEEQKFGQAVPPIVFNDIAITEIVLSKNELGEFVVQVVYNLIPTAVEELIVSKRITFQQSELKPGEITRLGRVVDDMTEHVIAYLESLVL